MANKHEPWALAQMQSLPLEAKIRMSRMRIRDWDEAFDGKVYVGFSGVLDSTVLKHLVETTLGESYNPETDRMEAVPSVFVDTGLEYPEIRKFAMSQPNVVVVRPEMRFDQVIKKYGYPVISKEVAKKIYEGRLATKNGNPDNYATRQFNGTYVSKNGKTNAFSVEKWKFLYESGIPVSDRCCHIMKKKPAKLYEKKTGRMAFVGTMASESKVRYSTWLKYGCNAFDKKRPTSQPLSFWTKQDILHYIKKYNIPYCSVYGDIVIKEQVDGVNVIEGQMNMIDYLGCYSEEDILTTTGCDRTGCIFCMFGCHLEKEPNRFQRLKETHPRQYRYCIEGGEMVDGVLQPNKEGLGLGKVLDYIGVKYD